MHRNLPGEQEPVQFSQTDCPQRVTTLLPISLTQGISSVTVEKPQALLEGGHPSRNFCIKIQILLCLCRKETGHRDRREVCGVHSQSGPQRGEDSHACTSKRAQRERRSSTDPSTGESSFGIRRKSEPAHCQAALRKREEMCWCKS